MGKLTKPLIFAACLVPFLYLLSRVLRNDLGPDPAQELAIATGEWTLRFLLIALAVTPVRQLTGISALSRFRRMLGLYALWYASWHFFVYQAFLLGFQWSTLAEELIERPYITVGFAAFLILTALGITSPKVMVKKLGRNWKRLHRLVYVAAVLGIIHLLWIVRSDFGPVLLYGSILALLLGYRLLRYLRYSGKLQLSGHG
ncbi:MAG: protein-methionine-sulfoxide reductase heme-binding subunit MsrQ [Pseudohongiellaceae bacterium]